MSVASATTNSNTVEIRECLTMAEYDGCLQLQREVFGFPELEVSPRRHLVVSREAGGWTLVAVQDGAMVGFVHHLAAVRGGEIIGYSHMMAVSAAVQNQGIGARLKWAQRERALAEGVRFIRWTWDPMQARNAHFNLNRLGVVVHAYAENFYGTNYSVAGRYDGSGQGLDSDRLFAEWHLDSARVRRIAEGAVAEIGPVECEIAVPADWSSLVKTDPAAARVEQLRVRGEFQSAFADGLVCTGFVRDDAVPRYLLQRTVGDDR
jgi:predicted GNAT superfamily acetyltransferase